MNNKNADQTAHPYSLISTSTGYIVKLGFLGVHISFRISALKHRL